MIRKTLPIEGGGKGWGVGSYPMPFLPLTLTFSPKGRGGIIFDNTATRNKEE